VSTPEDDEPTIPDAPEPIRRASSQLPLDTALLHERVRLWRASHTEEIDTLRRELAAQRVLITGLQTALVRVEAQLKAAHRTVPRG
jgi:hypothetical protein